MRLCNYTDVYYRDTIRSDQAFMAATATAEQIETFGLRSKDIIITKDSETPDDIGVATYVAEAAPDLICGYHLAVIRPRSGRILGRYLYWAIRSKPVRAQLSTAATGVTRFGLRTDAIKALRIALPPLDEQRRIVALLDAHTQRLGRLVRGKQRLHALLQEKGSATLDRLVGNGMRTGEGLVPLKYLVDQARPIMYGIVLPGSNVDDGILLVKGGDVERGSLRPDLLARVAPDIEGPYARARLKGGDLLVSIRGSSGAVAEVPPELTGANITQDSARVAPGGGVEGRYLLYALRSPFVNRQLSAVVTGATVRGINIRDLKLVKVPLPAPGAQHKVVRQLDELSERVEQVRSALSRQVATIGEHREALITAAATGQLDPSSYREPAVAA